MGCHYTKWCMLIWLTLHSVKVTNCEDEPQAESIEFGTRLRPFAWDTNSAAVRRIFDPPKAKYVQPPNAPQKEVFAKPPKPTRYDSSAQNTKQNLHPHKLTVTDKYHTNRSPEKTFDKNDQVHTSFFKNHFTDSSAINKKNLVQLQNLQFNRIEPFWPFSNLSSVRLSNSFKLPDGNLGFPYDSLPERFKDTTFFFSHMGPNSFEYRAQFHHSLNDFDNTKFFKPFVNDYPDFPKITFPPFPSFPEPPKLFHEKPPHLPAYPGLNDVPFPTIAPDIKRILEPAIKDLGEIEIPEKIKYRKPFKPLEVLFGEINSKYPKIFRFNDERINIEDFEKDKKLQMKMNGLHSESPENVQRNHLLILHGGIFTVKEPPLYNRKFGRKRRPRFRDSNRINVH